MLLNTQHLTLKKYNPYGISRVAVISLLKIFNRYAIIFLNSTFCILHFAFLIQHTTHNTSIYQASSAGKTEHP